MDIKEYLNETLEYGEYKIRLVLATNNNDPVTREIFDRWGIDGIEINENKSNVRDLVSKTILQSFLEAFVFQTDVQITLESLIKHPDRYPLNIMIRKPDGSLVNKSIQLTEINTLKFVFTSQVINNAEIYMSLRQGDGANCGYDFSDGVLTLYVTQSIDEQHLTQTLTSGLDIENQLPTLIGYEIIDQYFFIPLLRLPYTVKRLESAHGMDTYKFDNTFYRIQTTANSYLPAGLSMDQYLKWTDKHAFFRVTVNPGAILPKHTILLKDEIEYEGYQYPFKITYLTTDLVMKKYLFELGINAIHINPLNGKSRLLLAKAIINAFREAYVFQTGKKIDLEEFIKNPEKYQIGIMLSDADGKIRQHWITLDQIDSFDFRLSNVKNEVYISLPEITPFNSGYALENGTFVIYTPLDPFERGIRDSLRTDYNHDTELPLHLGFLIGHLRLRNSLGLLPYNNAIYYGQSYLIDKSTFGSGFDQVVLTEEMPTKLEKNEYIRWLLNNCLFIVET